MVCAHIRKHSYTNDEGEADPDVELMPPVLAAAAVTNNNSSSGKAAGSSVNNSSSSAATAVDADSMEEGSSLLEPLVGKTSSDADSSGAVAKSVSNNVRLLLTLDTHRYMHACLWMLCNTQHTKELAALCPA
eukprot:5301-Heterococcus_DN1.PRE.1